MSKEYTFLTYEVRDHVAHVTFDSPSTNNTYSAGQEWEIFDMLERVQNDDDVHAVALTGAGDVFGGSSNHSGAPFSGGLFYERAIKMFGSWLAVEKPIVVAYHGSGILTIPLLSDIVIVERQLEIKDTHVHLGVPAATGAYMWPLSTGLAKAKRYLLTGDAMSAEEAERIGLVAEVVDTGKAKERARALATQIAALDPTGVQQSKRALNEWMRQAWGPIFKHALSLEFLHFPAGLFG